ncbi:MAG: hypothetical protein ACXW30_01795 [Micavibrio sp.]
MTRPNIDQTNILLMLLSCGLAYVLPFELVLLSYAFLGPAHYLTQISWLHDRDYFTGAKWLWIPLTGLIALMVLLSGTGDSLSVFYIIFSLSAALCCALVLAKDRIRRAVVFAGIMLFLLGLRGIYPPLEIALVMLLPTVIHIYVFTGVFILLGALKSKERWGLISFMVFLACGAVFFIAAPANIIFYPDYVAKNIGAFATLTNYLIGVLSFGGAVKGSAVLGFLSFAYTYHYLNWFSKTDVIKWHLIPRKRLAVIVALYLLSVGIYLVDYKTGFVALMFLSFLHVVLEFPLNVISIRNVAGTLARRPSGQG